MDRKNSSNDFYIVVIVWSVIALFLLAFIAESAYDSYLHDCKVKRCKQPKIAMGEYCELHTCDKELCRQRSGEGRSYCDKHYEEIQAEKAARKAAYDKLPYCSVKGCDFKVSNGKQYCVIHKCSNTTCNHLVVEGGHFCITHTCQEPDCNNGKKWDENYCSSCQVKNSQKTTTKTTSATTSGQKKTKKVQMPDCDDYESYEDFMDEWDGCMPDGSDAEDYWENW